MHNRMQTVKFFWWNFLAVQRLFSVHVTSNWDAVYQLMGQFQEAGSACNKRANCKGACLYRYTRMFSFYSSHGGGLGSATIHFITWTLRYSLLGGKRNEDIERALQNSQITKFVEQHRRGKCILT
jgi:hypothetical protein